jgi:hypothetical protein
MFGLASGLFHHNVRTSAHGNPRWTGCRHHQSQYSRRNDRDSEHATNETRTAKTNPDGLYTVSNLAPGVYEVTISMVGFCQLKETNLQLDADQTARLDAALQIGTATKAVTVSSTNVGLLNTETSSKGDLITPVEISEIPLVALPVER